MKNICDWKDCKEIGEYKAPKERDNSRNFRYLCLEHIKIFNKNWNYFADMNDEQIGEMLRVCEQLGNISCEYFAEEFVFLDDNEGGERLHTIDYLNIAEFNALYWKW